MIKEEMNLRLFCKGVKIDERTQNYIEKRLFGIEKMIKKITSIEVEISLDKKGKFRVEVMVKTPYQLYRSEEVSESIEGSTDIVAEELKNQIRKDKEKIKTLRIRGKRSIKKNLVIDESARF